MFAVIHRWKSMSGRKAQFEKGWRIGTAAIAREFGALGVADRSRRGWLDLGLCPIA